MAQVVVLAERCKSCGMCVSVCPRKILAVSDRPNKKGYYPVTVTEPGQCTGCALCGIVCPDVALEIYR